MRYQNLLLLLLLITGTANAQPIGKEEKRAIFEEAQVLFAKEYFFKDKIAPTIDHLNGQWQQGRYDSINQLYPFLDALAQGFRHHTHDAHLTFFYSPANEAVAAGQEPPIPFGLRNEKFLNNGINAVQILAGDVGYIRIQAFGAIDDYAAGAFAFVQHTKALIIDVRGNGGGMLSNSVSSYLLPEESIHLLTIYGKDRTDSIYTVKTLKGPRYLQRPVYILTDKVTFSSAEDFAYGMQAARRATIVGEATGGGANPGGALPVHQFKDGGRLDLFVPLARVENPLTKSNWESEGVQPDVAAKSESALQQAHLLALKAIAAAEENKDVKAQYGVIIAKIQ